MKQTAVEWLCNQIYTIQKELEAGNTVLKNKIEQAKAMEKEQIIDARQDGHNSTYIGCESGCGAQYYIDQSNEQYYNETFKSE